MNKILQLLKNRFVQLGGIAAIFYFGLLANKDNQDGLGYRLSKENITKNISEANQRAHFIISSIQEVNAIASGAVPPEEAKIRLAKYQHKNITENFSFLKTEDLEEGRGEEKIKCDDEVNVTYEIYIKQNNVKLESVDQEKIIIGSNIHPVLEQKIWGMKKNGERIIHIPYHLRPSDNKLVALLKFNETDLYYHVKVNNFHASDAHLECVWIPN